MPRISSLRSVVITGLLSFVTPACEGKNGANFNAGANYARARASEIVTRCRISGRPVSACIRQSGLSVSEVCAPLIKAAKPGCSEEFTRIKFTGRGLEDK